MDDRKQGLYERFGKRAFDLVCSALAIIVLSWFYLLIALLVRIKLGAPVLFRQPRPGKGEKLFYLAKFRTMTEERDASGKLLPDEQRLTPLGNFLRETSIDELPELFSVLKGEMSLLGPRPLLVRDMVFMSPEHRRRHDVRPGLSGLAQVHGRNDIDWEKKLDYDLQYLEKITFWGDLKLIFQTVFKVLKREGITEVGSASGEDYGDYLLNRGKVSPEDYEAKQAEAREILGQRSSIGSKQ